MEEKSRVGRTLIIIILIIITIIMLLPVYFMVITSLKTTKEMLEFPPTLFPKRIAFENFLEIFKKMNFLTYYKNSVIIAVLSTIGTVLSSAFVAFGMARYKSRFKKVFFVIIIATLLLPYPALIIPQFLVFRHLGWVDTFLPLIVPSFFGNVYFIFMLRQFFKTLPDELFDAARIDGCNEIKIWWKIAMPLCGPALATVAIFQFLYSWNDLIDPVIYLSSDSQYTLPIGMSSLISHFRIVPWNLIMVGNLLALLPILIIFFKAQKYFIEGIALTGTKA
jgi:multiple sugar transport system permease protein